MEVLLSGAISGLIGVLGTYVILKKVKKDAVLELQTQLLELPKLGNDENFQKFCYLVGGLIGKGARSGIGMDRKMKPQDLVMNLIGNWIESNRPQGSRRESLTDQRTEEDPLRIK